MRSKYLALFLLSFLSLLIGCSKNEASGDGPITLAINTKVGDKQVIETDIDQKITTKVMEQDLSIDQKIEMDMTLTTKEVKDTSSFVIEGAFDRWAMKMDMKGASMANSAEFDTKDSTKNKGDMAAMMSQMFTKMIGLPFTLEMARNGKVIKTNMKEVMATVMPPGASGSIGDDGMSTVPFPDHPVKPGDSWTGEIEKDVSGNKTVFKANYTLKEVKDGVAIIAFTGEVLNKTDNKKLGTMTGTYGLSASTGMLKNGEIKMNLDMEVDNPAGSKQQVKMDQTIKMTGKS